MQTTIARREPPVQIVMEDQPLFNVVIVYEDFAAGKHAQETYDYLVQQLGRDFQFTNQMWKFDVLGNAKMRDLAVKDAVAADLIIVSTHGVGELPAEVKMWLDQWLLQKTNAMALVALVDRPEGEAAPDATSITKNLQEIARLAGIGFFAQPHEWPNRDGDFSTEQISERAEQTSHVMADIIQHSNLGFPPRATLPLFTGTPRWGINE